MPEWALRAFNQPVFDLCVPYVVTDDTLIPWDYQTANPMGRFLHDDWAVFKDTPRIFTARRVPLPFKQIYGQCTPTWMPWDAAYPSSPGLQIEDRQIWNGQATVTIPHALVDCAVEGSGYSQFACWLGGKWVPCFTQYRKVLLGRLYAQYSGGLKQDVTVAFDSNYNVKSDIMGWIDPPSFSYNKT